MAAKIKIEDDAFLTHRERIGKAYFQIEELIKTMDKHLTSAEDYPEEISKKEAQQARMFIDEAWKLVQNNFGFFVEMVDD